MSQRVALLISTALTVLMLLAGMGLAIQAVRAGTADAPDTEPDAAANLTDADREQDRQYRMAVDALLASNASLATSFDRISALNQTVDELQAQNTLLRQREERYQALLAEANVRLQHQGQAAVTPLPPDARTAEASAPDSAAQVAEAVPAGSTEPSAPAEAATRPPAAPNERTALRTAPIVPLLPVLPSQAAGVTIAPAPQVARAVRASSDREDDDHHSSSGTSRKRRERDDDD